MGYAVFSVSLGLGLVGITRLSPSVVDTRVAARGCGSARGHVPTARKHIQHKLREVTMRGPPQPQGGTPPGSRYGMAFV